MDQPTISVTIDHHRYTLRPRELNAWQTATFEAETGTNVEKLVGALDDPEGDPASSLTNLARFVFLVEIQNGHETTFRSVAERITYGSDIGRIELSGLDDEDDDELEEEPEPSDPTTGPAGSSDDELGSSSGSGAG